MGELCVVPPDGARLVVCPGDRALDRAAESESSEQPDKPSDVSASTGTITIEDVRERMRAAEC